MTAADDAVFIHVGLPKTGTTHVQATMAVNRRRLREQGVLYPRLSGHGQHFLPVLDLLQVPFGGIELSEVAGLWNELLVAVQEWPGRAVVSHELLSGASSDIVGRLVSDFAPRPVHAIVGVRDLSSLLPAVWQERAKNQDVESWRDFRAEASTGPGGDPPHQFWHLHDVLKVLRVWREHIAAARIHVVTIPRADAGDGVLFGRFADVIGVDASDLVAPKVGANASIGVIELAILHEVNVAAEERLDSTAYRQQVKRFLVPQVLSRRPDQLKVTVPESDRGWMERYTQQVRAVLSEGGFDVVGDVGELSPTNFADADGQRLLAKRSGATR